MYNLVNYNCVILVSSVLVHLLMSSAYKIEGRTGRVIYPINPSITYPEKEGRGAEGGKKLNKTIST